MRMLNEAYLKDAYSSRTYYRGHTYYQQQRVTDLEYNEQTKTWIGFVEGTESYTVMIQMKEQGYASSCECLAYHEFGECKHEVAVLLAICEQQATKTDVASTSRRKSYEHQRVNSFIQSFADFHQSVIENDSKDEKEQLSVEYICKSHSERFSRDEELYLTIEVKVGVDRTYVVKDLRSFLEDVAEDEPHEFTKRFSYDPIVHYFTREDEMVLNLLQQIVESERFYKQTYASPRRTVTNKELVIPTSVAKPLLHALKGRDWTFVHEDETYRDVLLKKEGLPFSFFIDENQAKEFQINFRELDEASFFNRYRLIFASGHFYELTKKQRKLVEGLLENMPIQPILSVDDEQMGTFLSQVVPGLRKVGEVKISQAVENQVMSPPLQAKLWVEKESKQILVTLEYHYGDFAINPFQNTDEKPRFILVRDMEKEAIIMDIIEHAPINIYKNQLYLQQDEEAMFEFLFRILPQLEGLVDIRISEEAKQETLYDASNLVTSIDLEQQSNLLEINFDLAGIDDKTVQEVLKSVLEKKKYYRLNNGAFLSLEQDGFQQIRDLFTELNVKKEELEENRLHVPLYKGMQVEEILGQSQQAKGRLSEAFQTLVKRIGAPDESNWRLPSSLYAELRDYQYTGFRWFKSLSAYSLGGILADDMGLGKTLQTIAYLLSEKKQNDVLQPSLIVVPASLVYNWKNEFEKFAPSLKVQTIVGTPKERSDLLQESADIFITSYPTLRQDMPLYKEKEFHALILDEAQTIKNYATKAAAAVRTIAAPKRFALSGTPIENSLEELWSIFQTILPGLLPSQQGFKKMSSERISKLVRPFILRRVKKDVLKELPDKIETTQRSELSKEQKELYVGYLEQLKSSLTTEDFQRNRMKILAGLTRLRQICCHPALFIENYEAESSKLEQLLETVHQALANGKRMLIFSQFTSMLHIIREKLVEESISFFYLDGQTDGKERVEMANRFNEGEHDIFLISLKAGGTGLNLTGADTVILYDLWWNPAVEEQAAGRAHRLGQKNVVQVIRLIAQGTIEEKIYEMQQKKRELISQVIQPGETMLTSLSEEELRELLEM